MTIRSRRYRVSSRFYLFVFVIFALLISLLILLFSPTATELKVGQVSGAGIFKGVLLFEEQIIKLPEFDDIIYKVNDRSPVLAEDTLATVYEPGYVASAVKDLSELQKNIVAYQNNNILKDIYKPELAQLDFDIEIAVKDLQNADINDVSYTVLNRKLTELMAARQKYVRENFSPDTYLQQLYADEESRSLALAGWQSAAVTDMGGYVAWYLDGYEENLNLLKTSTDNIRLKTIKDVIRTTENGAMPVNEANAKIVKKDRCLLAAEFDKNASFSLGQDLSLYLAVDNTEFKAKVYDIDTSDGMLVFFEIIGDFSDLIGKRVISFSTQPIYKGFVLPNKYIKNAQNSPYIIIKSNGEKTRVDIKVLSKDSGLTAFETSQTDLLVLGQKIYSK